MTKKDFQHIAEIIKCLPRKQDRIFCCQLMGSVFSKVNKRFNWTTWKRECDANENLPTVQKNA